MRRLRITLLIFVIVGSFGFSFLRYQANQADADNWFNVHWRTTFARKHWLRTVFGLHRDGDNQAAYLASDPATLHVVVHALPGSTFSTQIQNELASALTLVTQKPKGVTFSSGDIVPVQAQGYTRDQVRALANADGNHGTEQGTATVHLFLLNTFADAPTNIGMTAREDGIVIFLDAIADLARNDPATTNGYILSTILHEFGHQVGLRHVESADCIMAETVESPTGYSSTPTQFCQEELQLIETQRAQL